MAENKTHTALHNAMRKFPHDTLFKKVFSQRANAVGALRAILPKPLVTAIDWSTLRTESGALTDNEHYGVHTDLLFSAKMNDSDQDVLVYTVAEHKSDVEPLTPFQLLKAMMAVWQDVERKHPSKGKQRLKHLPPILPVLIHHDQRRRKLGMSFGDLYPISDTMRSAMGVHLPDFDLVVDDLTQTSDEDLTGRDMPASATAALLLMKHIKDRKDAFFAFLKAAAPIFDRAFNEGDRADRWTLIRYILTASKIDKDDVYQYVDVILNNPCAKEAYMSAAEELKQEGRQEGRQEGEQIGERRLLMRLLMSKFGDIPPHITERINSAANEDLERFTERILTAQTIDEVLGD